SAAHTLVLTALKTLHNEREIAALVTSYSVSHGAPNQAYPIIAGAGANGSTLHYTANNAPLAGKQLVVLDAGAEWRCYASDVTRTFPVGGEFTPEARGVYQAVQRMQEECIQRVRPGVQFVELHRHAVRVAAEGLVALGVLRGEVGEVLASGTVAAFFPHGLGHHVGLEVHDVSGEERLLLAGKSFRPPAPGATATGGGGTVAMKREWITPEQMAGLFCGGGEEGAAALSGGRQRLEKNMVVTIEPGIYFCREYIEGYFLKDPKHAKYINKAELDRYWDVGGVRIEDDILVTEDGFENLTSAPKGEAMLRVIREGSASGI
ncbi:peptidase M24, structural domain-containing protein, partial [Staphylotrichum tortipilum]